MKEKVVKWGVIGSGGMARRRTIPEGILQAPHAKLVSVYDINSVINDEVAREFHVVSARSVSELLDSEIDAIYIASPLNFHHDHVLACAKSRKHVFCEKPLGLSVEEAGHMVSVCKKEGVLLGIAFIMRFHSQHQAALKLIQEGKIGKPVYGRAQLSCWYPPIPGVWRQNPEMGGGGSLIDMGSHCVDLLEMFFGKVKKVSCFVNNTVHSYQPEDSAVVNLLFENGAMGTVDTFFCIPDNSSKNILELYGSRGSIIALGTIGQGDSGVMTAYLEEENTGYNPLQARNVTNGLVISPLPANTFQGEIEEFSCAILENREPLNNGIIGLNSLKIIEACYESAHSEKAILITP